MINVALFFMAYFSIGFVTASIAILLQAKNKGWRKSDFEREFAFCFFLWPFAICVIVFDCLKYMFESYISFIVDTRRSDDD